MQLEKFCKSYKEDIHLYIETANTQYAIHADKQTYSASIIKLAIAITLLKQIEEGNHQLDEMLTINQTVGGAGVIHYALPNQQFSIKQLIELMIIVSDNTASNVLLNVVGIANINATMQNLGMNSSIIEREFMDFEKALQGLDNYTTARDITTCLKIIDGKTNYLTTQHQNLLWQTMQNQQFLNRLAAYNKPGVVIGNKTGEVDGVENDVAIMKKNDVTIYVAVLVSNCDYSGAGQQIIVELSKFIQDNLFI